MLFNSINYFLFIPAVFILHYLLPAKLRWILLLLSSIVFYMIGGKSNFIAPAVIILSTFFCGILIDKTADERKKKIFFLFGLSIDLGLLIFYKYFNFIITSVFDGFNWVNQFVNSGQPVNQAPGAIQFIVPLGISYITFQAIGYLIEINRGDEKPESNLGLFATYLLFFPKLLSGPIERAHNFLPQLHEVHQFEYEDVSAGLKRFLWGLFLKLVIANRLALHTEAVFNNYKEHTGITLFFAVIFFTVQLYADFAGYTEMAIGSARILGFRLMENFDNPFIAKTITDFWRRWHISLTGWLNEYIYNPLVLRLRAWKKWAVVLAVFTTFLIVGIWHGASWSFVIFGLLHGFILTLEFLTRKMRDKVGGFVPEVIIAVLGMLYTFGYFAFSSIFFRVATANDAIAIVDKIFTFKLFDNIERTLFTGDIGVFVYCIAGIIFLFISGLMTEYLPNIKFLNNKNEYIRFVSILILVMSIVAFGVFDGSQFIYFKF